MSMTQIYNKMLLVHEKTLMLKFEIFCKELQHFAIPNDDAKWLV